MYMHIMHLFGASKHVVLIVYLYERSNSCTCMSIETHASVRVHVHGVHVYNNRVHLVYMMLAGACV